MVRVSVTEGILEGEILDNVLGGTYYSFKGIPYAAPPVGELRFKAPQPPNPWDGIRSAKNHGSICHQADLFSKKILHGSEDCLYLNIYSPNIVVKEPIPVMFWIHGGGFKSFHGNSDKYGPDFIMKENVILVTINYRLEVLGFLCLDSEEVPGNAGMKDQVAALRWVKKNIKEFGGDPENITIFGVSAGGASVAYHLTSPMTKGLFKRAIIQSGVNLSSWANIYQPKLRAEALARQLGKDIKDSKELYEFFKRLPVEKLVEANTPVTTMENVGVKVNIYFGVVNEKSFPNCESFFSGDVYDDLRLNIHEGVEVIVGYNTHEGLISFGLIQDIIKKFSTFYECFIPDLITKKCGLEYQSEVAKMLKEYYFGDQIVNEENIDSLLKYCSADLISYDTIRWAKIFAANNLNKLYLYKFDVHSERNVFADIFNVSFVRNGQPSVCHCDELPYIFNMQAVPINEHSKSYNLIRKVTKLWTNFAKYGNPTPDESLGAKWMPFDPQSQKYFYIGDEFRLETRPDGEEVDFWDKIFREYLPPKYHV